MVPSLPWGIPLYCLVCVHLRIYEVFPWLSFLQNGIVIRMSPRTGRYIWMMYYGFVMRTEIFVSLCSPRIVSRRRVMRVGLGVSWVCKILSFLFLSSLSSLPILSNEDCISVSCYYNITSGGGGLGTMVCELVLECQELCESSQWDGCFIRPKRWMHKFFQSVRSDRWMIAPGSTKYFFFSIWFLCIFVTYLKSTISQILILAKKYENFFAENRAIGSDFWDACLNLYILGRITNTVWNYWSLVLLYNFFF